jgi:hypothetical protein
VLSASRGRDVPLHPSEIDFSRRWYQAHRQQFESDPAAERELLAGQAGFARSATEALDHLSTLRRSGDLEAFRAAMQAWAVKPDTLAFNGFAGQMLLNQLVKRSEDAHQLAVLLADCLTVPTSDDDAVTRIRAMVDQIESVRTGGQPAPRSAVFLLSYFWAMADRRWPIHWTSAASFTEYISGLSLPSEPADRYLEFCARIRDFDPDCDRIERIAS